MEPRLQRGQASTPEREAQGQCIAMLALAPGIAQFPSTRVSRFSSYPGRADNPVRNMAIGDAFGLICDGGGYGPGPRVEFINDSFGTANPYRKNQRIVKTFRKAGAKAIRVVINNYDIEKGYDKLVITDANGG